MDEAPQITSVARCAVHEEAPATGTCTRCGNFTCPLCLDPFSGHAALCASCRERAGTHQMAWERSEGSWLRRYAATVRDVILRPSKTFDRSAPGSIRASFMFAAINVLVLGAVHGALAAPTLVPVLASVGAEPRAVAMTVIAGLVAPLTTVLKSVVLMLLWGLAYHAGARLAGGRGSLTVSLWSIAYLSAFEIVWAAVLLLQLLPYPGPLLILVGAFAIAIWISIRLVPVGLRFHQLSVGRAAFAAWFPLLVMFVILSCLCFGVAMNTLMEPGMEPP